MRRKINIPASKVKYEGINLLQQTIKIVSLVVQVHHHLKWTTNNYLKKVNKFAAEFL